MSTPRYGHVIWDFNGTLLDDVDACVATLASLLHERGLPPISREVYRARFGFPVRDFYEGLGFKVSRQDFVGLSDGFIARYQQQPMRVMPGALALIENLRAQGVAQLVVSAMETGLLGRMLDAHALLQHLPDFCGGPDLSAGSKIEFGVQAARERGCVPSETLLIGDTLHDLELAQAIGCRAVLFAGGHQSRERLAAAGVPVFDHLDEVAAFLAPPPKT